MTAESRRIAALGIVAKWAGTEVFPAAKIEGDVGMTFGQVVRLVKKLNEANFRGLIQCRKDLRSEGAAHGRTYAVLRVRLQTTGLALDWATLMPSMDFATKGLARLEGYDSATGHTALTKASVGGELAQVKHLISWGVNLDTVSRIDLTSLMSAVIFGHKEVFQSLLAAKADVNVRTREGTALLCAAIHGSLDLVQSLLAVKADVDAGDADGAPPLFRAALNGHSEVVQALITAGAKIDPTARYMARFERRRNLPSLLKFALGQGGRA